MAPVVAIHQRTDGGMIDRREILEAASSFSLLPGVVEKDYVLGWMLAGIYHMKISPRVGSSKAEPA